MASGCENVTARCEVICSPFWNILMLRRITMAAKGNCDPPQRTAKSRAASDPVGVPIYSPPFDPSLAPQHDGESMHIKLFALFYTGNRCYCRVEQILRTLTRKALIRVHPCSSVVPNPPKFTPSTPKSSPSS